MICPILLQVKLLTDIIVRTMVEPRRRCFSLPAVDLSKKAVSGTIYVTIISASKLSRNSLRGNSSRRPLSTYMNSPEENLTDKEDLQTFVEVELDELSRRTTVRSGSSPVWNSTFNMILHEDTGTLRFNLYESNPSNVKYDYLASCEVKVLSLTILLLSQIMFDALFCLRFDIFCYWECRQIIGNMTSLTFFIFLRCLGFGIGIVVLC